ncbi:MAG: arsenate reductase (glutaredoxin) [Kordiimonas sp.]|nr:arsenate reductase (glutaredoxin) [Kordiimonas sp.]
MSVTIYHNPRCSKSRQTLALLEDKGVTPVIVEYLKDVPSADTLRDILQKLGLSPRELMRRKEAEYKENDLDNADLSDEALVKAMVDFPKLIERPIVVNGDKAAIGRPPEQVLDII